MASITARCLPDTSASDQAGPPALARAPYKMQAQATAFSRLAHLGHHLKPHDTVGDLAAQPTASARVMSNFEAVPQASECSNLIHADLGPSNQAGTTLAPASGTARVEAAGLEHALPRVAVGLCMRRCQPGHCSRPAASALASRRRRCRRCRQVERRRHLLSGRVPAQPAPSCLNMCRHRPMPSWASPRASRCDRHCCCCCSCCCCCCCCCRRHRRRPCLVGSSSALALRAMRAYAGVCGLPRSSHQAPLRHSTACATHRPAPTPTSST